MIRPIDRKLARFLVWLPLTKSYRWRSTDWDALREAA